MREGSLAIGLDRWCWASVNRCGGWAGGIWVRRWLFENMTSDKVWSGVEKGVGRGIIRCDRPEWKNGLVKGDMMGNDDFVGGKVKATKSAVV